MENLTIPTNLDDLQWVYYGYANGWTEAPERLKWQKADPEATLTQRTVGNCETEFRCEKYKFYFKVDSSG